MKRCGDKSHTIMLYFTGLNDMLAETTDSNRTTANLVIH